MALNVTSETASVLATGRDAVFTAVLEPNGDITGSAVVHSASATPQGFYRAFVQYAAYR